MAMKEVEPENLRLTKNGTKISLETRAKILSESFQPSCVISELALSYGISAGIIYRWRRREKQKKAVDQESRFIEIPIYERKESAVLSPAASFAPSSALTKASLTFRDLALTVTVEGRVKGDLLVALVKMLEGREVLC